MAPSRESRLTPLEIARRDGLPRSYRSSTLRACGACRLALEQIPSARAFTALGEPPNVCTRMSSRLQKFSTVPLHELDAVMCTDLGGQQQHVRTADPGRVRRQRSRRRRPPGSVRCTSRLRRIRFPGDIPGLPPARSSDTAHVSIRTVRSVMKELRGHSLARRTPQGWLRGRRSLDGVASRNGTRGRLRRIVSSWRAERAAWRAVFGLPPCTY